jgi:heat shock protein HspQ
MTTSVANFSVGQIVHHVRFDYRGVIIDVDATFQGTDEWYDEMAQSKPPKDAPWYHVLVDGRDMQTYVAERNLEADRSVTPIDHPEIPIYFEDVTAEGYIPRQRSN